MAETRYKGKNGKVKIGTRGSETILPVTKFSFKHKVDALDVTDTGSSGQRDYEGGLENCEGTFEADWKAALAPFGSTPPNMKGGLNPSLLLYAYSADANAVFDSGTNGIFIEDVEFDSSVEGTVTYKVTWKSKPGFTVDDGQT